MAAGAPLEGPGLSGRPWPADEAQDSWALWRALGCSPFGGCGKQPPSTKQDISDADPSNVYFADDSDLPHHTGGPSRRLSDLSSFSSRRPERLSTFAAGPIEESDRSPMSSGRKGSHGASVRQSPNKFWSLELPDLEQKEEDGAAEAEAGDAVAPTSPPRTSFAGVPAAQQRSASKEKAADDRAKTFRRATTLEELRGVHIEKVYDFYDTATRKTKTRKMPRDVIHDRAAMAGEAQLCEEMLAKMLELDEIGSPTGKFNSGDSSSSSGIWSEKSGGKRRGSVSSDNSVISSEGSSSDGDSSDGASSGAGTPLRQITPGFDAGSAFRQRQRKMEDAVPNREAITSWAVFAGKLLHSRSLNFSVLAEMTLQSTRQVAAAKKSMIAASVLRRAKYAVEQAKKLAKKIAAEPVDLLDSEWKVPALEYMFGSDFFDGLMLIAQSARKLLSSQPLLAECQAPCRVFGDIHGQLRDLLLLLHIFCTPITAAKGPHLIFNGDFVDRGCHQVECIGLLLALKLAMPDRVWLIRGNHEDRTMNERYGFKDACTETLGAENGKKIFEKMQSAFQELPLACLIQKNILVVHGGIGDGKWRVGDIKSVPRPVTDSYLANPANSWVYNILWSDPIEDDNPTADGVFGVHASPRGRNRNQFGWDVTKTFCAVNGLNLIIRSHQSKFESLGFDLMHENLLIRVFSARDYEEQRNDGAVIFISPAKQPLSDPLSDPSSPKGMKLLQVRPQVIRSVMKTREEAEDRAKDPALKIRRGSIGSALSDPSDLSSPALAQLMVPPKEPDKKEPSIFHRMSSDPSPSGRASIIRRSSDPAASGRASVIAMATNQRRKSLGIDMFFDDKG